MKNLHFIKSELCTCNSGCGSNASARYFSNKFNSVRNWGNCMYYKHGPHLDKLHPSLNAQLLKQKIFLKVPDWVLRKADNVLALLKIQSHHENLSNCWVFIPQGKCNYQNVIPTTTIWGHDSGKENLISSSQTCDWKGMNWTRLFQMRLNRTILYSQNLAATPKL